MSLFTIGDMANRNDVFAIRLPAVLSILACNETIVRSEGHQRVASGIREAIWPGELRALRGHDLLGLPGDGGRRDADGRAGSLGALSRPCATARTRSLLLRILPFALFLPYVANSAGWIMTEMGRQPWIVFGVLKTQDAVSPNVSGGMVLASAILFTLLYGG